MYEYVCLYHAIEDTANQSTGKLLYIPGVSLEPGNRRKPPPTLILTAAYFLQISLTWLKKNNQVAAYFS